MASVITSPRTRVRGSVGCDPASSVTRSLLGYGVLAGPFYVVVSLAQAVSRDGFDLGRHSWSLLANGSWGWVQVANLVVTGLMTLAAAAGVRRALDGTPGGGWGSGLLGVYGVALVAAGVFRADPADGFPAGTPAGPVTVSWHGLVHLGAGGVGFFALAAACLLIARGASARGERGWALCSRLTGLALLAGFAGVASGADSAGLNVAFTAAVVLTWAWLSALAAHLYQGTGGAITAGGRSAPVSRAAAGRG